MKGSLKSFLNRCRCCLSQFAIDEQTTPITDFFEIQFFAFTHVELKKNERLSSHICEYCHTELLRFSVFKKELIEKQQQLYALLQHSESKRTNSKSIDHEDAEEEDEEGEEEEYNGNGNERKIIEDDDDDDDENTSVISEKSVYDESLGSLKKEDQGESTFEEVLAAKPASKAKPTKKRYTCDLCSLIFHGKQGLVSHMTTHSKKKKRGLYKCSIGKCDFNTNTANKLRIHKTRYHNKDRSGPLKKNEQARGYEMPNRIPCHCGCRCFHARSLVYHMQRFHGGFNKCTYGCDIQYKSTGDWIRHIRERHPEHENVCLGIAKAIRTVNNEVDSEEEQEENNGAGRENEQEGDKFECKECYKIFTHSAALRSHVNTFHNEKLRFECSYCGKKMKQLSHLRDHLEKIHKVDSRPYTCWCDESFATRTDLKNHKQDAHEEIMADVTPFEKPSRPMGKFVCFCKKSFFTNKLLTSHHLNCITYKSSKREDYTAEGKEHRCPKCDQVLACRSNLLRHQKMKGHYSKEQMDRLKYTCSVCKQKFFSEFSLKRHAKFKPECDPQYK